MHMPGIPYLLRRSRTHRALARQAERRDVRCVHRQFVKLYQRILVDIRSQVTDLRSPMNLRAMHEVER